MKYEELQIGDTIIKNDEYNLGTDWHEVPDFIIGDTIARSARTEWRRRIIKRPQAPKETYVEKKKWFEFWRKDNG